MAYTTPSTQPTATVITSSMYNNHIINNIKFLHGPPTVRATRAAVQSISNNTWTAISWPTPDWDSNTMLATTGTKMTCKTAGKYLVCVNGSFANSSAGSFRGCGIQKNTTTANTAHEAQTFISTTAMGLFGARMAVSQMVSLTTGQYIRVEVIQDTGGSLNTSTGGSGNNPAFRMSMVWMSS